MGFLKIWKFGVAQAPAGNEVWRTTNTKQLSYATGNVAGDRVCANYTISGATSITVPNPYVDGRIADFVIYLDMTGISGSAPAISYQYSDGSAASIIVPDGTALSYEVGAVNAVYFTQVGSNQTYAVACRAFKSAVSS